MTSRTCPTCSSPWRTVSQLKEAICTDPWHFGTGTVEADLQGITPKLERFSTLPVEAEKPSRTDYTKVAMAKMEQDNTATVIKFLGNDPTMPPITVNADDIPPLVDVQVGDLEHDKAIACNGCGRNFKLSDTLETHAKCRHRNDIVSPEATDGHWSDEGVWIDHEASTAEKPDTVTELRRIRQIYDDMEIKGGIDSMEQPPREFVTWRGWKMIRNVITDRIEELTGERQ